MERRERLQDFGTMMTGPTDHVDVMTASVLFSADAHPEANPVEWRASIETLGQLAHQFISKTPASLSGKLRGLLNFFHAELGFKGNSADYHDPRNSNMIDVLLRRTGLPINLTMLVVHFARFCGLEAHGVGIPGHFMGRCETEKGPLFFDAFSDLDTGRILTPQECVDFARGLGAKHVDETRLLTPADNRSIVERMLNNLAAAFARSGDAFRRAQVFDWLLLMYPGSPVHLLERGQAYAAAGFHGLAIRDLTRFTKTSTPDMSALKMAAFELLVRLKQRPTDRN